MSLELRDYQTEALAAIRAEFEAGRRRTALVLATGLGKTITFARPVADMAATGKRAVVLAHRDELTRQAHDKIEAVAPELAGRIGTVKAERNETGAPVIVASTQTLVQRGRAESLGELDFVVADECHHYAADSYRAVLERLGCWRPEGPQLLGVTATLARADGRALGDVWETVAYERDALWGMRNGYLVRDARGMRVTLPGLDLDAVSYRNGDFSEGDLGRAMLAAGAPAEIAKVYAEHASDRKGLVFTPSVDTAHEVAAELCALGIEARSVWGAMPVEERRKTLAEAFSGAVQVLVNCMVLTEGFDWPEASCVVVARPTSSAPLYIQIVGRVLRTFPGKTEALVIDVTGVGSRHKLASLTDLAGVEVKEGETVQEAAERAEGDEGDPVRREIVLRVLRGKQGASEFDLFGSSRRAWKQTKRGTWFLSDAERYYAIAPSWTEPGRFHVVSVAVTGEPDGRFLHRDLEMSLAMAWGEHEATQKEGAKSLTYRNAAWRNAAPSAAQLARARMMGIIAPELMTKGDLSEEIDMRRASKRLDRLNVFKARI